MKKFNLFAMLAVVLTIFNACKKGDLEGVQNQVAVSVQEKQDVYAENGYLVFQDFASFDSINTLLNISSDEFIEKFEFETGYKSAYSFKKEVVEKSENLPDSEKEAYLKKLMDEGYFDNQSHTFKYPFYNETRAVVLNRFGKVKIGKTFYRFEGDLEVVTADVPESEIDNYDKLSFKINVRNEASMLKSASILFDNTTSGGQQRLNMRVLREYMAVYDYIVDPRYPENGLVWGLVGYQWTINLRFHSYRQRLLSAPDRNTYFHWITKHCVIGGNDGYYYLNYNPSNPFEEKSPYKAIFYFELYKTDLTIDTTPPIIHNVDIDCWSERLSNPVNHVIYSE